MIALYHTAVGLFLLLFSFVRLPFPTPGRGLLDLNVLFVLYLAFFRPVREGAAVACALGLAMDSLSAGPFGLHFVVYLFLFTIFRLAPRYLQVRNALFLAAASAAAAVIGGAALALPALAAGARAGVPAALAHRLLAGGLLAFVLGWPAISGLRAGCDAISAWQAARRA